MTGTIPKTGARATQYHIEATPLGVVAAAARPVAATPPATTTIDIPLVYRTLLSMPRAISRLDGDVFWCSVFVVVVGALNAVLLAALPKAISKRLERDVVRRVNASVGAMLETTRAQLLAAAAPNEPIAFATRLDANRTCACGSPIGARSRTGLCRRCAQVARLARLELEPAPSRRALNPATHEMGDLWEPFSKETVARARIGECRQYYTITVASLDPEPATPLN